MSSENELIEDELKSNTEDENGEDKGKDEDEDMLKDKAKEPAFENESEPPTGSKEVIKKVKVIVPPISSPTKEKGWASP